MTSFESTLFINDNLNEQTRFPFLNTNPDLIAFHLTDYLDKKDIISLFLTCKKLYIILDHSFVWHKLFKKTFNDTDTSHKITAYKWSQLYRQRRRAKVMACGDGHGSRLGFQLDELDSSKYELSNNSKRLIKFVKVFDKQLDNKTISDVTCGEFSLQILTYSGQLFCTGNHFNSWHGGLGVHKPGPLNKDKKLPSLDRKDDLTGNIYSVLLSSPYDLGSWEIFKRKHISVSSGRAHFISLDNYGCLWSWDASSQENQGIELKLRDLTGRQINDTTHKIISIKAGWDSSSAFVANVGIVIWNRRNTLDLEKRYHQLHYRVKGLYKHPAAHVECRVVSSVNYFEDIIMDDLSIRDYVVLDGFLIYITALGNLFRVDLDSLDEPRDYDNFFLHSYPLMSFRDYIRSNNIDESLEPKFIRLSGCYNNFACISNKGLVLLGDSDSKFDTPPKIIDSLQRKGCISVEIGDHHFLALFQNGELYSWGSELNANGCLGLGKIDDMIRNGAVVQGMDIHVDQPTKVPMKGKVLSIAAGGHQSAAIVAFDDEDEEETYEQTRAEPS
ncbi:hypothetical protein B5S28_g976 [[Candida] boidinii]|nr:hypothetical protein B5S28_g976 [[Candida] boidinii]